MLAFAASLVALLHSIFALAAINQNFILETMKQAKSATNARLRYVPTRSLMHIVLLVLVPALNIQPLLSQELNLQTACHLHN